MSNIEFTRRCKSCDDEFSTYDRRQRYCSMQCARNGKSIRKAEAYCERVVRPKLAKIENTPIIQRDCRQYEFKPGCHASPAYNGWRRVS